MIGLYKPIKKYGVEKMKKKKIAIICCTAVFLLVIVSLILFFTSAKDVKNILNKEITLSESLDYCCGIDETDFTDDFSQIYSKNVSIKVNSIDEDENIATIEIKAPDFEKIMRSSIPENTDMDYDSRYELYMANVKENIASYPENDKTVTTVEVYLLEEKGTKISVNSAFVNAAFPNYNKLLNEVLIYSAGGENK